MFNLPSLWNLIISTIAFFIAAWYINRYLDEHEIPKGMSRGILVFLFASIVSWGAGDGADWVQEKIMGKPVATTPEDLSQLLKAVGRTQP
jgi:hypothetical protein